MFATFYGCSERESFLKSKKQPIFTTYELIHLEIFIVPGTVLVSADSWVNKTPFFVPRNWVLWVTKLLNTPIITKTAIIKSAKLPYYFGLPSIFTLVLCHWLHQGIWEETAIRTVPPCWWSGGCCTRWHLQHPVVPPLWRPRPRSILSSESKIVVLSLSNGLAFTLRTQLILYVIMHAVFLCFGYEGGKIKSWGPPLAVLQDHATSILHTDYTPTFFLSPSLSLSLLLLPFFLQ